VSSSRSELLATFYDAASGGWRSELLTTLFYDAASGGWRDDGAGEGAID
jgi:hypothetical protein